jgi:hypothetical protein
MSDWLDSELPRVAKSIEVGPPPMWLADDAPARRGMRMSLVGAAMLLIGLVGGSSVIVTQLASSHPSPPAQLTSTPTPSPSDTSSPTPTATPTATATPSGSPSSQNHGAIVSAAAHNCPHGPNGVHGKCVSAVAQSDAGKPDATPSPTPTS